MGNDHTGLFGCYICRSVFYSMSGLRIHHGRMHKAAIFVEPPSPHLCIYFTVVNGGPPQWCVFYKWDQEPDNVFKILNKAKEDLQAAGNEWTSVCKPIPEPLPPDWVYGGAIHPDS